LGDEEKWDRVLWADALCYFLGANFNKPLDHKVVSVDQQAKEKS
jgi:hypothetical protein